MYLHVHSVGCPERVFTSPSNNWYFLCPQSSLNADWYIGCPQRDLQSEYSKGRSESRDGRLYTMKIYNGSKGRSEAEMDGEQNGIREKKRAAELNEKKKKPRWSDDTITLLA